MADREKKWAHVFDAPGDEDAREKRWGASFELAPKGETARRPKQEQAVSFTERIQLQNLASGPEQKAEWLKGRGYEAQALPSGQVAAKKRGAAEWGVIDEQGGSLMDILDAGDEVAFGLLTAAGGASTAAAGPMGLLASAGGAAVGGATAESLKKGLGAMAGFHETPGNVLRDVAVSGAVGGVAETLLRGSGRAVKGLAGRYFGGAPKPKLAPAPRVEPPVPKVEPEIRPEFKPSAPPLEPSPVAADIAPAPAPRPDVVPETLPPRTPTVRHTVRHTVTRDEAGGAPRETVEQVFRPAEKVEPHISAEEAVSLTPGAPHKVVDLVDPAPGEAVYITFLKKAKKGAPQEVRTMQVHGNARHPTWFSEAEVAQHADEMPITMLRELVAEHGPAPGIIKKTFGTAEPADLERAALSKWLFEKQPGVVTGRGGPPGTRAAENRRHQLFQFWEQFSEHTPGVSAARGEKTLLRNVIPGTKEYGGYRRGAEKNVLELRVGDRVYRFGKDGNPAQISGEPAPAPKIAAAPASEAAKPARAKGEPTKMQKVKKKVRQARRAASLGRTLVHPTPRKLITEGIRAAVKLAEKYTPGAYAKASEGVREAMASIARILESRGREAALSAAYAIAWDNKEFKAWLERQSTKD